MRLFIAIAIPEEIRAAYGALIQELRGAAPQAKWVRAGNLHVTLKFLGDMPLAKSDALNSALAALRSPDAVTLEFRGLGFFPNEKRPRVLWAGMATPSNLKTLALEVDQAAHRLGFPLEQRLFKPHLTLARFDPPGIVPKLLDAIQARNAQRFGELKATEFHLIESKLKPSGAEYTTLQTFRFAPEG